MASFCFVIVSLVSILPAVSALECYTCSEARHNNKECKSTTRSCEQFQDACTTYIKYASPPEITSRGKRIYYISKDCDTRQGCERRAAAQQTTCRRSYFNDWACTECCYDDLCNYFINHGVSLTQSKMGLGMAVVASLLALL